MRTAAVLPVKGFPTAKQRLGRSVEDGLRRTLVEAMVSDVLLALSSTTAIEVTIVVTAEPSVGASAAELGAIVVEDERHEGQSAAAALGVERALAEGIERVLCVPGDCPALDPLELELLLAAATPKEVVVVPDRHGRGTNGLLLHPPTAIPPSFGPDSCQRHLSLARAAGMACRVERLPSLVLDVDTRADLDALRERLEGTAGDGDRTAVRTRALLAAPATERALSLSSRP